MQKDISIMAQKIRCINSFTLKLIAIVTMTIDHIGAVLFPQAAEFRYIGRIAFPIFVFLLVEGFYHTKNIRKYEMRMLLFVALSEIPFDLAFYGRPFAWEHQNVFFTLTIGLIMLDLIWKREKWRQLLIVAICMLAAALLSTDYGAGGILLIFIFYQFRNTDAPSPEYMKKFFLKVFFLGIISLFCYGAIECFSLFAMIPIFLYNGKRGPSLKYVFYIFYPAHLLVLYVLYEIWWSNGVPGFFGGILL